MAFPVFRDDGFRFRIGQVPDTLLGVQVEFDPRTFPFRIDQGERVAAIAVHVAVRSRNAAVAHGDGHLVQGFGQ